MHTFCLDENIDYAYWEVGWWNDAMTSYACGSRVHAHFCNDWVNDECRYGRGAWAAGNTKSRWVDPNDRLSTVKLFSYDADRSNGAVTLFNNDDCTGSQGTLFAGDPGEPKGYIYDEMWGENVCNNCMNAVMIPVGYTMQVFDTGNFRGDT